MREYKLFLLQGLLENELEKLYKCMDEFTFFDGDIEEVEYELFYINNIIINMIILIKTIKGVSIL